MAVAVPGDAAMVKVIGSELEEVVVDDVLLAAETELKE